MPSEEMAAVTAEINQAVEEFAASKAMEQDGLEDGEQKKETSDRLTQLQWIKSEADSAETGEQIEKSVVSDTEAESKKDDIKEEENTPISAPPVIGDEALMQAVYAGIPLADARAFPNEESLIRVTDSLRQVYQTAESKSEKTEDVIDPFADFPKLDPEVYEPEVIQMFDRLTGIVKQQQEAIQQFQNQHSEITQATQAATAREVEQWFDKQVSELGEDFSEALGKGGYNSLNRGSSQFTKREQIANYMAALLAGYRATGQQSPSREEVFDVAARFVLRDEYQKVHEKKLTGDLEKRASQHIQRASGKKTSSVQTPEDETVALLNAKYGI
ncbi:MAG: hypothetical protein KKD00_07370 [Gammaproteobacteria bacterium]|nr:hypothetical protein [Gammaproteobacteria bacterium]